MNSRNCLRPGAPGLALVCLLSSLAFQVSEARAAPMWYVFDGVGTGTVGSTDFTDARFTITSLGNTDDITVLGPERWAVPVTSRVFIDGVGEGLITQGTRVIANPGQSIVSFARQPNGSFDIFGMEEPPLAAFNLRNAVGPVREFNPLALSQFTNVGTELGALRIASMDYVDFTSSTVPEPAAVGATCAVGAVGLLRRRRPAPYSLSLRERAGVRGCWDRRCEGTHINV